jgi:hypothetical protein
MGNVYEEVATLEISGSHLSLDRDSHGEETVNLSPDWVEGAVIAEILAIARRHEMEVVLTKDGLRLAPYTDGTSLGVQRVKRVLEGEDAGDSEDSAQED